MKTILILFTLSFEGEPVEVTRWENPTLVEFKQCVAQVDASQYCEAFPFYEEVDEDD